MATFQIVSWRHIPASVEVRDAGQTVTRELSERFQMLIDSVAMQFGAHESDAYLEDWHRSEVADRAGTAAEVADAVVAELEGKFQEFAARAFRPS